MVEDYMISTVGIRRWAARLVVMSNSPDKGYIEGRPNVVVIGGGFGGVACVRRLGRVDANVVLIDRQNHSLFQPLLYQVATGVLADSAIASPLRRVFGRRREVTVLRGEVDRLDFERCVAHVGDVEMPWTHLVAATGVENNYFGREDWAEHAPGMKSLSQALEVRSRVLNAFEQAELARARGDRAAIPAWLTFVVVGAGATGVELAGAIKQLAVDRLASEFKNLDVARARVVLVEGGDRVLAAMSTKSSAAATRTLESYGVEIRLNTMVTDITDDGVRIGDDFIASRTPIWAAGVKATGIGPMITSGLGMDRGPGGRVPVNADLTVGDRRDVRVVGDLASCHDPKTDGPVPGVAQGAIQMGAYVGDAIGRELRGRPPRTKPFQYFDKGSLATIGRGKAVLDAGPVHLSGFVAWVVWAIVHITFLINFRSRIAAMWSWAWAYVLQNGVNEIITGQDVETVGDAATSAPATGTASGTGP